MTHDDGFDASAAHTPSDGAEWLGDISGMSDVEVRLECLRQVPMLKPEGMAPDSAVAWAEILYKWVTQMPEK